MKKLNKLFAILVAMAMVLSLSVIAAFADEPTYDLDSSKIAKNWVIPEGVADPSLTTTFTFEANRAKSSGVNSTETLPTVETVNASYNNGETPNHDILAAGKTEAQAYPIPAPEGVSHAGVYAYDVVETQPNIVAPDVANDSVKKDDTTYRVRYYYTTERVNIADENEEPNYVNRPKLTGITVAKVTVVNNEEQEEKISPTPGTTGSQFAFTNVYTVTNGEEQPPQGPIDLDKVALKVTKTVTGTDAPDGTKFPFTITFQAADGQSLRDIKGYIYNIDSVPAEEVQTEGRNDARADADAEALVPNNQGEIKVELTAGQALAFIQLPAGTRYKVSETLDNATTYTAFVPEYTVTSDGSAATAKKSDTGSAGQTLETAGEANKGTYLLGSNKKDTVAYTNTYDKAIISPTGILMNNLPYIVLALVAIGGLVAYVVVRRRNADEA